ncbi:Cof-type HAD-IIB family hydrolase [Clostridium sediminicola]|uniref:Cof-type HAD-IIB family hydrolase n=1 Tax=Clostridium sediminicola TaxID=3114879 RepID=UPI0031F1CA2A
MVYKLVCIDMDGTLLNSKHKITENTKEILKKAHDLGVHIVITTGRIYTNAEYYSDLLGVKSAVIASNGSYVKDKDIANPIYEGTISEGLCKKVVDICSENNIGVSFYTSQKLYCGNLMMRLLYLFIKLKKLDNDKTNKVDVFSKRRWSEILHKEKDNIIKCEIMSTNENKLRKVRNQLNNIEGLEVVSSHKSNIEVTCKGVSKGKAVKIIADYYNIKKDEVIAIGDSENDLSMIEYAGLGIAMGNALDIIKRKSAYITETNDNEGVAKAIEKFIL